MKLRKKDTGKYSMRYEREWEDLVAKKTVSEREGKRS